MFLHVLRHINADHRIFRAKHRLRECLGKLCFSDTRRPQEQKRTDWYFGSLSPTRPRRIARATADTASSCPTTRSCRMDSSFNSRSDSSSASLRTGIFVQSRNNVHQSHFHRPLTCVNFFFFPFFTNLFNLFLLFLLLLLDLTGFLIGFSLDRLFLLVAPVF